jgi:negative regulator of flagellin synthesis FlgM
MINGVGSPGPARIGPAKDSGTVAKASEAAGISATDTESSQATTVAGALADAGPPIDAAKIASVKAAIAEGRYPIDAKAIAEKMVAFDLPRGRA